MKAMICKTHNTDFTGYCRECKRYNIARSVEKSLEPRDSDVTHWMPLPSNVGGIVPEETKIPLTKEWLDKMGIGDTPLKLSHFVRTD